MSSFKEKIFKLVEPLVQMPVAGLDISDRSVKYMQFRRMPAVEFEIFGEMTIPEGLIKRGEIIQEEPLAEIFKKWLSREGKKLRNSALVASLPEEKSFTRLIQIPKIQLQEVQKAIRWELETNVPLPPDQVAYDYEIVEPLEDHLDHYDVLVTAFPKKIIDSYINVLGRAGFQLLALEPESQAMVRSLVSDPRQKRASIIVDMGRMRTSFIIFAGGSIKFTDTIELGGKTLEDNIIHELKVDPAKAEALKKEVGLNRSEYEGRIFSALAPAIAVLSDELRRAIDYYRNQPSHQHGASPEIGQIILTGGDANLLGVDTYLSAALNLPVYPGNPLVHMAEPGGKAAVPFLPKNRLSSYATVIGLALRGWEQ